MKKITIATLIYASAPSFLFAIFWLRTYYSALSVLCMSIVLLVAIFNIKEPDSAWLKRENKKIIISSLLLSFVICLCSEFGAIAYESKDYVLHNYKFNLLATQKLPLYNSARDVYMCYYLGFYMVPALLGKYTSLIYIKYFVFIWAWIGMGLTFSWVQYTVNQLTSNKRILVCAALIVGSYVNVIFPAIRFLIHGAQVQRGNTIILNDVFQLSQIPALTRGLSESTQHALPGILGTAFLMAVWNKRDYFFAVLIFFLSTVFLSPFVTIGLLPFVLFIFWKHITEQGKSFFYSSILYSVPLALAFLPIVLFLTSTEATNMKSNGFIWQSGTSVWWAYYISYLVSSYGVWILLFQDKLFILNQKFVWISMIFMVLISFGQIGYYNDLHIRSTTVPQMVFGISIAYVIVTRFNEIPKLKLFTFSFIFWCLNSLSPIKFFYDRIFVLEGKKNTIENPKLSEIQGDYYDLLEFFYPETNKEVTKQYSLKKNTIFEKYLLNKG